MIKLIKLIKIKTKNNFMTINKINLINKNQKPKNLL